MSEQYKIDVQTILNTAGLQEQLNKQKFKVHIDIDNASLGNQVQEMVSRSVSNIQPLKIPVEAESGGASQTITALSSVVSGALNVSQLYELSKKNLD